VFRWLEGKTGVAGWTSSLLAIVFFGGASLFGLGVLGEYMHLMMREVRRPPRWNIRTRVRAGAEASAAERDRRVG
jgi:hypothetical protein